jgi:hypothetical protein
MAGLMAGAFRLSGRDYRPDGRARDRPARRPFPLQPTCGLSPSGRRSPQCHLLAGIVSRADVHAVYSRTDSDIAEEIRTGVLSTETPANPATLDVA